MEYNMPGPSGSDHINNEVVLPTDNWQTKIIEKKIIEDDKCSKVQVHLFLNITNREDFRTWLVEYENLTGSSYVIASTYVEDGPRLKFKQILVCHHYTKCKETYNPSLKTKTRNTNCPARLYVKIHVIRKKYRGKQENYDLIKHMPCEIVLIATHNHSTDTPDSLRFRKVSPFVREELMNLYRNGHNPGTALEMIKCHVQLSNDNYIRALADRNQCPDYKYCYDVYRREFKQQSESSKFKVSPKTLLQNKLMLYNDKHGDLCAKMAIIGQEHAGYVIGICTPIMKRVHKNIENASNIVFMDSSDTADKDGSRIYVMLTDSECGALPLGLIITNSESVEAIKCGLQILTDLLGENIFGGHKEGPKVFMTEDSLAEQIAIKEMWPQVKFLFCIFHVLQAVWTWLSQSRSINGVPKEQRTQFYRDFRNILYSKNFDEMFKKYELAVENAKAYHHYLNYFNNHWWTKKELWVKAYRNGWLINNDRTKNYPEATIRQIKEQIFSRIKTFNVVQMVDFMITKFEDYNKRKLLDASRNRLREDPLYKEVFMPSTDILQRIVRLDECIVAVPSEANQNIMFAVNMEILMCSCIQGIQGVICKHIDWANMLYHNEKYTVTIDNYQIRQKLYFIATGETLLDENNDSRTEEVKPLSIEVTEQNEHLSETNINENKIEKKYGNLKEKFKEAMEKISLIFYKHFEQSPLKVATSVEKMVGTLEKIKTPAAFSSAVASFGFAANGQQYTLPISNLQNLQQVRRVGSLSGLENSIQLPNPQPITVQNIPAANGQHYTLPVFNLQNLQQVRRVGSVSGLENSIQLTNPQPITVQNIPAANGQHYTLPVSNLQNLQQVRRVGSLSGLGNSIQLPNPQPITVQNSPGLGNVQVISQQQPQISVGPRQQVMQRDPNDPAKRQIIPQVIITASPQPNQVAPPIRVSTVESLPAPTPPESDQNKEGEKQRVRRTECTCPNCQKGGIHSNNKNQHICHIPGCNKVYENTSNLRAHLSLHSGQRSFACTRLHCGKRFKRSDELLRHRRIHTRENLYQCSKCNKKFIRSDYLLKHIKNHQKQSLADAAPISESTVESSLPASSQGRQQQRVRRMACTCPNCQDGGRYSGRRKLHKCHISGCNKLYVKTSHLRAHLIWHTGQRPFVCTWVHCGKRFIRSDELQRHRRIHTRDKRFQCLICYKKFMRSDHLSKHLKTHQVRRRTQDDEAWEIKYDPEPQQESELNSEPVWITDSENGIKYTITHLDYSQEAEISAQQFASSDNSSNEEKIIIIVDPQF